MLRNSGSSRSSGSSQPMIGIILLRIGAGLTLLYLHAWNQGFAAWHSLWDQTAWTVPTAIEKAGLPFPQILAIAAATIVALTTFSWIFGFAVRFISALFIPVTIASLLVANVAEQSGPGEAAILYFFIALTLLFNGAGWLSFDTLFQMRKGGKKKKSKW